MTAFQANLMSEIMPGRKIEQWDVPEFFDEAFEYALNTLNSNARKAVEMRFRDNLPFTRIGEAIGCKPPWARELVQKAVIALRELDDQNLFFDYQNFMRKQEAEQKALNQKPTYNNPVLYIPIEELGFPDKICRTLYRNAGKKDLTVGDVMGFDSLLNLPRCGKVTARTIISTLHKLGCDTAKWETELRQAKGGYHGVGNSFAKAGAERL